jgi:hypothetical protein
MEFLIENCAIATMDGRQHDDAIAHRVLADWSDGPPDGDPVAALVFGPPAPLELLLVGGIPVVERGELRTADVTAATRDVRAARLALESGR